MTSDFELGPYTDMILVDLQEAFDTVNQNVLIKKMELLRFSGLNIIYQIGNSKFILRILCRSLKTSFAEFFKEPF